MQFSLNAFLMLGLGLLLLVGGVYAFLTPFMRMLGAGLIFTGAGCIFCGLTDGFTDPTPRGVAFQKLGYASFVGGIPILAYSTYYLI